VLQNVFRIKKQGLTDRLGGKEAWRPTHFFITPDFFFAFSKELSYGYLRFEGNGKTPLGR
jgi:hypothetical protein